MARNLAAEGSGSRPPEPGLDGRGLAFALVCGRFNSAVTVELATGARAELLELGVAEEAVRTVWVPGAFEIPLVAKKLAASGRYAAVIALGAVIRGETGHYDHVAGECAAGLRQASLETGVPILFGVLTTETAAQARARIEPGNHKGRETARAAVEMARLLPELG